MTQSPQAPLRQEWCKLHVFWQPGTRGQNGFGAGCRPDNCFPSTTYARIQKVAELLSRCFPYGRERRVFSRKVWAGLPCTQGTSCLQQDRPLTASQGFVVPAYGLVKGKAPQEGADSSFLAHPCWAIKGVHLCAAQFTTEHESHSCAGYWSTCSSISFVSNLALEQKEEL